MNSSNNSSHSSDECTSNKLRVEEHRGSATSSGVLKNYTSLAIGSDTSSRCFVCLSNSDTSPLYKCNMTHCSDGKKKLLITSIGMLEMSDDYDTV